MGRLEVWGRGGSGGGGYICTLLPPFDVLITLRPRVRFAPPPKEAHKNPASLPQPRNVAILNLRLDDLGGPPGEALRGGGGGGGGVGMGP